MNKMKTTIAIAAALAAGASTQSFAASTAVYAKEGTITFALTAQGQNSVSTSSTVKDAGDWWNGTTGPKFYRTAATKLTQVQLIQGIGQVLYGSPTFFSPSAKLVLVQGELSGFFNISPDLQASTPTSPSGTNVPPPAFYDGPWTTSDSDASTVIANSQNSTFVALATGAHFLLDLTNSAGDAVTLYPPGHLQPWGQIFVKDTANKHGVTSVNVTPFFQLSVHECYDCFYLNSFISDANFAYKSSTTGGSVSGPPCCQTPTTTTSSLTGNGTDRYYLSLGFDDTQSNPYLKTNSTSYLGTPGIPPFLGVLDGTTPDALPYSPSIVSHLGQPSPYEIRFTLNGILTYKWALKKINSGDTYPDFIGSASYEANGYGFIALVCQLITGSASINEVNVANGLGNTPWSDDWYGYDDVGIKQVDGSSAVNVPASLTEHSVGVTPDSAVPTTPAD